jgi:hypothetical protein
MQSSDCLLEVVNTSKYENDMVTFSSYEDVLTLLVHLGYDQKKRGIHSQQKNL